MNIYNVKVCYVLSYREINYIRTVTLTSALKKISKIKFFEARNTRKGVVRYLETFLKFLKIRFTINPDIYIIGFRGHEIYWLLRIFALRKKFIFDEMMSPYISIVYEKKYFSKNSIFAKILFFLERSILNNAEIVLTDTNLHAKYFSRIFKIKKGKIKIIPVGSNIDLFNIKKIPSKDFKGIFTVFTYATFLPLHGMDVVLKAVSLLKKYPINFVIIGGKGKTKEISKFRSEIDRLGLKNVKHLEWLDFNELISYIKGANVCLGGPFGGTPQAKKVVTGKTYQFLSMGKLTVIGKIDEDFGFIDKYNCLLVEQKNEVELAKTLEWCYKNRLKLNTIKIKAISLYKKQFTSTCLSNYFLESRILNES